MTKEELEKILEKHRLDMIIHQMDNMLKDQEHMKEQISAIASKVDKQGTIITKIEERISKA